MTTLQSVSPTEGLDSSKGWRIFAHEYTATLWDVDELEFYDDANCSGVKMPSSDGTPISSGYYNSLVGDGWSARQAFDGYIWGGRPDNDGDLWLGKSFSSPVSVKCVKVKNDVNLASSQIQVQALNPDTGSWDNVFGKSGLDTTSYAWNTISIADSIPTTAAPSKSPTNNPTESKDVWQISFTGVDANFTATSATELSLQFDIGKNPPSDNSTTGRYNTTLYEKDCTTELATSGPGPLLFTLTDNGRIPKTPANFTFDAIELLYNVNKTMIATSSVWNSTTNEIEICQVVQLIEQSSTYEMVIIEEKRVITINFDLSVSFDLEVELEEGAITSANTTTNVQDYVAAYKCDANYAEDNSPLIANNELFVCIESSSVDVEIGDIQTMTIKQGATDLPVIASVAVAYTEITEKIFVSAIKQVVMTRVPSNIISFAPGQVIDIDGSVTMQLVGSSGRMLQTASNTGGTEAATASFDIKVALQPEATREDVLALNSATSFASKTCVAFGVVLALAVW